MPKLSPFLLSWNLPSLSQPALAVDAPSKAPLEDIHGNPPWPSLDDASKPEPGAKRRTSEAAAQV